MSFLFHNYHTWIKTGIIRSGLLLFIILISQLSYASGSVDMASRHQEAVKLRAESEHRRSWEIDKEIAGAYKAQMSKADKLICLEAMYGCIDDSFALADYTAAARYMVLAEEIRDSENIDDARLEIYYSCMYIAMSNQSFNDRILAKSYPHALKAFDYAVKTGDKRKMELAFFHLIGYMRSLDMAGSIHRMDSVCRVFVDNIHDRTSGEIFQRYYQATKYEYKDRDYVRASLEYDTILSLVPRDCVNSRKLATFMIYAAPSRINSGKFKLVESDLRRAIEMSDSMHQAEYKLVAYNYLEMLENARGDSVSARYYRHKQDSLNYAISSFPVADDIYTLDQINEEKELHRQISIARYHNQVFLWVIIFIAVVLVIVIVFFFVLRRKNISLKERARLLHGLLREQSSINSHDVKGEEDDTKAKYSGSSLTEEEKKIIARDIKAVLESEAVFSSDFNLSVLAEKIDRNPKAVSQVINEFFNSNFSTVVNRIRIYEACRRMDSPDYANWSVEGIAESVGYTQRNTFSTNFKKFTGMGIREYRKLSEEEKNDLSGNISEE